MAQQHPTPFDVAIVGGGLAGWIAASAAGEAGRRVAVIEQATRRPGWGNSMVSGGALHAVLRDPRTPPDDLIAMITEATDGHADPVVVRAWAHTAARTISWIEQHGGELAGQPGEAHRAKVFAPVRVTEPGMRYAGFGVTAFLRRLRAEHLGRGGVVVQPARATSLSRHGDSWVLGLTSGRSGGAAAGEVDDRDRDGDLGDGRDRDGDLSDGRDRDGDLGDGDLGDGDGTRSARHVVLADGGFQASPALLRTYVGTDQIKLRGVASGRGDGLRMGLAAGGVAVNMRGFYGHLLARDALTRDDLWPYPILDLLAAVGVVVGPDGRRLVDEGIGGVTTTNEVAWSAAPLGCWLVVDDDAWRAEGAVGVTPPNPWLVDHGATVLEAPTVAGLAAHAGIAPEGLVATVAAIAEGRAHPPRTGVVKLARAPFRAIPLIAGVTFTLGGLLVDGHGRVLDAAGAPIAGLYAAGGTMGGLHGGPRVGYAGGLLEAAVFGLLAGEHSSG